MVRNQRVHARQVAVHLPILLLTLLTGCASKFAPPPQATVWEGRVRWIELEDYQQVRAACRDLHDAGLTAFKGVAGCYKVANDVCVIITQRIEQETHFRVIGHELVHCAWGPFHDKTWQWVRPEPSPQKQPKSGPRQRTSD